MTSAAGSSPGSVLLACCVAFFWVLSYRAVVYGVLPAASSEMGLGPARAGLVIAAQFAGYMLAVSLSPLIARSRRRVIVAGFVVATAALQGLALATSAVTMALVGAVGGMGLGLYLPRGTAAIAAAFDPRRRGFAMGWHEVAASAGLVAGPLFAGAVLAVASWRAAVAAWGVIGVVACVAVWRGMPEPATVRSGAAARRAPIDARIALFALLGGAGLAVHVGFYTILPLLLAVSFSVTPPEAATYAGWTRATGLLGALAGGVTADRLGRRESLLGWYAIVLVGAAALTGARAFDWALTAAVVTMTVGACAAVTASYALLADAYDARDVERLYGPIAAIVSLIGSVATPIVLGYALEHRGASGVAAVMLVIPLLGIAGAVLYRPSMAAEAGRA